MRKRDLLCAATLNLIALHGFAQSLPVDPRRTWRVLETENFEIIYDVSQKELAQTFAKEAERARGLLVPLLKPPPMPKIPVAIADITDSSNGAAMPVPRSQIELYPVLPTASDATSEYYDWSRELITHEFTHILNFEPSSGFMDILRTLFGSIIKPDSYLPRWYLEGLAVEMESRLTPVGRGRSHYYSALVRSLVEDDKWGGESIDRIGETEIPTWPRGQRPYTFGFFLMHELSELENKTASQESIYRLLDDRYGHRIPWFIEAPVEDYFGLEYSGLLNKTYARLQEKALKEISDLHALKKPSAHNQEGYFNTGAQISPDGLKLAAIVDDYDDFPSIRLWTRKTATEPFDLANGKPRILDVYRDTHQISWRPDSRHLIFDHSDTFEHFNVYDDIWELDTETFNGKAVRITHGLRAREPAALPDGSVAFIKATGDRTILMVTDPKGENPQALVTPNFGERISSPRAFRDGVIYSHRDRKGKEWIEYLALNGAKPVALTHADHIGQMHIMPVPDKGTGRGFFFASSDSGVMNIYHSAGEPGDVPEAVTNVSTYATSPEIDAGTKSVIYSRLTSEGFKLETQTAQEKIESPPRAVGALYDYPAAEENEAPPVSTSEHTYLGAKYLFPQYVIPFIYFVPNGEDFTLSTAGSDPLNHHQYAASLGYDTRAGQPTEEFEYTNGSLPFAINLEVANDYIYLVGANLTEHFTFAELNTRHFILPDSNKLTFGPELTYRRTDYSPYLFTEVGPGASLFFNNVSIQKDYQISPESGESFSVGYDYFLPSWGNTAYPNVNGFFSIYLAPGFFPKHHVISEKLSASISPPQQTILTGFRQGGGEYIGSLFESTFLVRGYPVGEFLGYRLVTENFEYRFPISYQYSGYGTLPVFIDRWHGAVIFDAATLDGEYYDSGTNPSLPFNTKFGKIFTGAGAELRCDFQAFYGFPLTARLGAYYGFNPEAFGGVNYYLGFGLLP